MPRAKTPDLKPMLIRFRPDVLDLLKAWPEPGDITTKLHALVRQHLGPDPKKEAQ
jgi:hypothetical protein